MEKLDINAEEEIFSAKIIDNILNEINSKKQLIKEFKEKYLNKNIFCNNMNNYSKERNDKIMIKINDISQVLDSFKRVISISIKAIAFLLIKIKNSKNLNSIPYLNRYSAQNIKSYSPVYAGKNYFKLYNDDNNNYNNEINNNLMKDNSKSYNYILSKEKSNKNNKTFKIITNLRKCDTNNASNQKLIDDNIYKLDKINKKENNRNNHSKITINTNFNNYLSNMHDNTNSHNSHNYQDISNPYKNHLITSHIDMRHKHYMNMDSNKQKSQYIKIKNFKLKIKSPLRQTLKEMINKQKIKKNKKYGYSTLNTKKSNSKYKSKDTIISREENKNESLNDIVKFSTNKLYIPEKYVERKNETFIGEYKTNNSNKLVINNNELQILSNMVNYNSPKCLTGKMSRDYCNNNFTYQKYNNNEKIPISKIKISSVKNLYGLNTPKSQENRIFKVNSASKNKNKNNNNNKYNNINNNINLTGRHNTNNETIQKYKSYIDDNNKFNFNNNIIINSCNRTFED